MCGANVTEEGPIEFGTRMGFILPEDGVDLKKLERDLLVQALERTRGNKARAGRLLGLSRDQVRYRMERYGIK